MADVKIMKFDVGSPTDKALATMQERLNASTGVEAFRRSLAIAEKVTSLSKSGKKLFVEDENGNLREIIIT